jgi:hypothetical protein
MPFGEPDQEFRAGEVRAQAPVRSRAEGEVPVVRAVNDDLVGVRELRGVAVG